METNILNEIKRTQTLMGVENINTILESEKNKGLINEVKINLNLPKFKTPWDFNAFKSSNPDFRGISGIDDLDFNTYKTYQLKSIDNIVDLSDNLTALKPYWIATLVKENNLSVSQANTLYNNMVKIIEKIKTDPNSVDLNAKIKSKNKELNGKPNYVNIPETNGLQKNILKLWEEERAKLGTSGKVDTGNKTKTDTKSAKVNATNSLINRINKKENTNYSFDEIREKFGSDGSDVDEDLLQSALKDPNNPWRPGKVVDGKYRTKTKKLQMSKKSGKEQFDTNSWKKGEYDMSEGEYDALGMKLKFLPKLKKSITDFLNKLWFKDKKLLDECKSISYRISKETDENKVLLLQTLLDEKMRLLYRKSHNNFVVMRNFFEKIAKENNEFSQVWSEIKNKAGDNFWTEFGMMAEILKDSKVTRFFKIFFNEFFTRHQARSGQFIRRNLNLLTKSERNNPELLNYTKALEYFKKSALTGSKDGFPRAKNIFTNENYKNLVQKYGYSAAKIKYLRDIIRQWTKLHFYMSIIYTSLEFIGDRAWKDELTNCKKDLQEGIKRETSKSCKAIDSTGSVGMWFIKWALDYRKGDPDNDTKGLVRLFDNMFKNSIFTKDRDMYSIIGIWPGFAADAAEELIRNWWIYDDAENADRLNNYYKNILKKMNEKAIGLTDDIKKRLKDIPKTDEEKKKEQNQEQNQEENKPKVAKSDTKEYFLYRLNNKSVTDADKNNLVGEFENNGKKYYYWADNTDLHMYKFEDNQKVLKTKNIKKVNGGFPNDWETQLNDTNGWALVNSVNESIISKTIKNMLIEEKSRTKFGEDNFKHWKETFQFKSEDEKNPGQYKNVKINMEDVMDRINHYRKKYDEDDAFVRAVVDTHENIVKFMFTKDLAHIRESVKPVGLALILSRITESRGEMEIWSVARPANGNWFLVKGDFNKNQLSNMDLKKVEPKDKVTTKNEKSEEGLKKKEETAISKLRQDEKDGIEHLPRQVKMKIREKLRNGWTTEEPYEFLSDFYTESEINSIFNDKIKIYKLKATKGFFEALKENSPNIFITKGFCKTLNSIKNDSDITDNTRPVVKHLMSKCENKFGGDYGFIQNNGSLRHH